MATVISGKELSAQLKEEMKAQVATFPENAPSRLYSDRGCEKIGTAAAPPGLSVGDIPDTPYRLSLRRGEVLVMCSDGADGEEAASDVMRPPEVLAAELLARCDGHDDATVVTVRLQAI